MEDLHLRKSLRQALRDTEEPYIYQEEELCEFLQAAVLLYSKYQPVVRMGQLQLIPNVQEYVLPEDYQLWKDGLQGFYISGNKLFVESSLSCCKITYFYYANRRLSEIPEGDKYFLLDYCVSLAIEAVITRTSKDYLSNQDSITALKLGKGLDITFGTMEDLKKNLSELMEKKKTAFLFELQNRPLGGWC